MTDHELPTRAATLPDLLEQAGSAPAMLELHRRLTAESPGTAEFARAAGSLPAIVAATVIHKLRRPVLYVAPEMRHAERVRDDLRAFAGEERAVLLPPDFAIPYDPLHQNHRFDERAGAFERLIAREFDALIVVPPSLVERYTPLDRHEHRLVRISEGDQIDREALALVLAESGMRREIRVEDPGGFAIRGSVIDIFPPSAETPVRLELWGDEITELREFDPASQRSLARHDELLFYAGERANGRGRAGIWQLVPRDTVVLIDDSAALAAALERHWEEIEYQYERRKELEIDRKTREPDTLYHRPEAVFAGLALRSQLIHRGAGAPAAGAVNFGAVSHESFLGDLDRVASFLRAEHERRITPFILCDHERQVDRIADMLEEHGGLDASARLGVAPIHAGFTWPDAHIAVLTDHEIFGRHKRTSPFRRRRRRVDPTAYEELKRGDYVVHEEFGIGRYLGPTTIRVRDTEQEVLQVEYRDGVKVYVRLDQFARLQKYRGTEGEQPKLSKIGSGEWQRSRRKTKAAVEKLAKEILEIYAQRQLHGGTAFREDTPWQRELEAAFEFEDTPDQALAADEVKQDLERPLAMDRLLVGDVGFGKTEVAVRAAFKAIQDSKQVAVLVPTTILAQQHFATFSERLRRYPLRIEVLSRFRSQKERREVVEGLANGDVDLVIGTHRLLSRDVRFKDLGLLVVDEEHRFGVKSKEAIRRLRATVDVLSMSATPIPRTLHMALSGARDMSMISTPPQDRLPIETEIVPYDERVIREAILREVARGGQVYFVHNRVETIENARAKLQRMLPHVKIAVAHGQMKESELADVMEGFLHEKYQVLVCTMIIESGLDISNVNTLLVDRADRFGLAQLYQLRGRIGRSHRQAYAYLLTPPRMLLQRDAKRRLETIAEHTRLGSGFQIAMRDLEIRGAGNLLGPEQSGHINAVGFEMYSQMLANAVRELSEEGVAELPEKPAPAVDARDVRVDVALDAMLPAAYVPDAPERVDFYRRISRAQTPGDVDELRTELRDRYGALPDEAVNLLRIVKTQALAAPAGVAKIDLHETVCFLTFRKDWGKDDFAGRVSVLVASTQDQPIELKGAGSLALRLDLAECDNWDERWRSVHDLLATLPVEELAAK
ncbi:MAG: Transcription-repair-coupling factor [Calditrichaeota bacterium]|nr:Transcription-repair-coupling factor [Calditrichota bacterium]